MSAFNGSRCHLSVASVLVDWYARILTLDYPDEPSRQISGPLWHGIFVRITLTRLDNYSFRQDNVFFVYLLILITQPKPVASI